MPKGIYISKRKKEMIYSLISEGKIEKEISEMLDLSIYTINYYSSKYWKSSMEDKVDVDDIICCASEQEASTFFIFRPIKIKQHIEIKVNIDFEKETVKTSRLLQDAEMEFVRFNIYNGRFKVMEKYEVTNQSKMDY